MSNLPAAGHVRPASSPPGGGEVASLSLSVYGTCARIKYLAQPEGQQSKPGSADRKRESILIFIYLPSARTVAAWQTYEKVTGNEQRLRSLNKQIRMASWCHKISSPPSSPEPIGGLYLFPLCVFDWYRLRVVLRATGEESAGKTTEATSRGGRERESDT